MLEDLYENNSHEVLKRSAVGHRLYTRLSYDSHEISTRRFSYGNFNLARLIKYA